MPNNRQPTTDNLRKGFSLIEMVIYIAVLTILVVVVMNLVLRIGTVYGRMRVSADMERSAGVLMDRLVHEIRSAHTIDMIESNLGAHPGKLVISKGSDGNLVTSEFYIGTSTVYMKENNVDRGPLTVGSNVSVTNLVFRVLESDVSKAVKIEATLQGNYSSEVVTESYYTTVLLRGAY